MIIGMSSLTKKEKYEDLLTNTVDKSQASVEECPYTNNSDYNQLVDKEFSTTVHFKANLLNKNKRKESHSSNGYLLPSTSDNEGYTKSSDDNSKIKQYYILKKHSKYSTNVNSHLLTLQQLTTLSCLNAENVQLVMPRITELLRTDVLRSNIELFGRFKTIHSRMQEVISSNNSNSMLLLSVNDRQTIYDGLLAISLVDKETPQTPVLHMWSDSRLTKTLNTLQYARDNLFSSVHKHHTVIDDNNYNSSDIIINPQEFDQIKTTLLEITKIIKTNEKTSFFQDKQYLSDSIEEVINSLEKIDPNISYKRNSQVNSEIVQHLENMISLNHGLIINHGIEAIKQNVEREFPNNRCALKRQTAIDIATALQLLENEYDNSVTASMTSDNKIQNIPNIDHLKYIHKSIKKQLSTSETDCFVDKNIICQSSDIRLVEEALTNHFNKINHCLKISLQKEPINLVNTGPKIPQTTHGNTVTRYQNVLTPISEYCTSQTSPYEINSISNESIVKHNLVSKKQQLNNILNQMNQTIIVRSDEENKAILDNFDNVSVPFGSELPDLSTYIDDTQSKHDENSTFSDPNSSCITISEQSELERDLFVDSSVIAPIISYLKSKLLENRVNNLNMINDYYSDHTINDIQQVSNYLVKCLNTNSEKPVRLNSTHINLLNKLFIADQSAYSCILKKQLDLCINLKETANSEFASENLPVVNEELYFLISNLKDNEDIITNTSFVESLCTAVTKYRLPILPETYPCLSDIINNLNHIKPTFNSSLLYKEKLSDELKQLLEALQIELQSENMINNGSLAKHLFHFPITINPASTLRKDEIFPSRPTIFMQTVISLYILDLFCSLPDEMNKLIYLLSIRRNFLSLVDFCESPSIHCSPVCTKLKSLFKLCILPNESELNDLTVANDTNGVNVTQIINNMLPSIQVTVQATKISNSYQNHIENLLLQIRNKVTSERHYFVNGEMDDITCGILITLTTIFTKGFGINNPYEIATTLGKFTKFYHSLINSKCVKMSEDVSTSILSLISANYISLRFPPNFTPVLDAWLVNQKLQIDGVKSLVPYTSSSNQLNHHLETCNITSSEATAEKPLEYKHSKEELLFETFVDHNLYLHVLTLEEILSQSTTDLPCTLKVKPQNCKFFLSCLSGIIASPMLIPTDMVKLTLQIIQEIHSNKIYNGYEMNEETSKKLINYCERLANTLKEKCIKSESWKIVNSSTCQTDENDEVLDSIQYTINSNILFNVVENKMKPTTWLAMTYKKESLHAVADNCIPSEVSLLNEKVYLGILHNSATINNFSDQIVLFTHINRLKAILESTDHSEICSLNAENIESLFCMLEFIKTQSDIIKILKKDQDFLSLIKLNVIQNCVNSTPFFINSKIKIKLQNILRKVCYAQFNIIENTISDHLRGLCLPNDVQFSVQSLNNLILGQVAIMAHSKQLNISTDHIDLLQSHNKNILYLKLKEYQEFYNRIRTSKDIGNSTLAYEILFKTIELEHLSRSYSLEIQCIPESLKCSLISLLILGEQFFPLALKVEEQIHLDCIVGQLDDIRNELINTGKVVRPITVIKVAEHPAMLGKVEPFEGTLLVSRVSSQQPFLNTTASLVSKANILETIEKPCNHQFHERPLSTELNANENEKEWKIPTVKKMTDKYDSSFASQTSDNIENSKSKPSENIKTAILVHEICSNEQLMNQVTSNEIQKLNDIDVKLTENNLPAKTINTSEIFTQNNTIKKEILQNSKFYTSETDSETQDTLDVVSKNSDYLISVISSQQSEDTDEQATIYELYSKSIVKEQDIDIKTASILISTIRSYLKLRPLTTIQITSLFSLLENINSQLEILESVKDVLSFPTIKLSSGDLKPLATISTSIKSQISQETMTSCTDLLNYKIIYDIISYRTSIWKTESAIAYSALRGLLPSTTAFSISSSHDLHSSFINSVYDSNYGEKELLILEQRLLHYYYSLEEQQSFILTDAEIKSCKLLLRQYESKIKSRILQEIKKALHLVNQSNEYNSEQEESFFKNVFYLILICLPNLAIDNAEFLQMLINLLVIHRLIYTSKNYAHCLKIIFNSYDVLHFFEKQSCLRHFFEVQSSSLSSSSSKHYTILFAKILERFVNSRILNQSLSSIDILLLVSLLQRIQSNIINDVELSFHLKHLITRLLYVFITSQNIFMDKLSSRLLNELCERLKSESIDMQVRISTEASKSLDIIKKDIKFSQSEHYQSVFRSLETVLFNPIEVLTEPLRAKQIAYIIKNLNQFGYWLLEQPYIAQSIEQSLSTLCDTNLHINTSSTNVAIIFQCIQVMMNHFNKNVIEPSVSQVMNKEDAAALSTSLSWFLSGNLDFLSDIVDNSLEESVFINSPESWTNLMLLQLWYTSIACTHPLCHTSQQAHSIFTSELIKLTRLEVNRLIGFWKPRLDLYSQKQRTISIQKLSASTECDLTAEMTNQELSNAIQLSLLSGQFNGPRSAWICVNVLDELHNECEHELISISNSEKESLRYALCPNTVVNSCESILNTDIVASLVYLNSFLSKISSLTYSEHPELILIQPNEAAPFASSIQNILKFTHSDIHTPHSFHPLMETEYHLWISSANLRTSWISNFESRLIDDLKQKALQIIFQNIRIELINLLNEFEEENFIKPNLTQIPIQPSNRKSLSQLLRVSLLLNRYPYSNKLFFPRRHFDPNLPQDSIPIIQTSLVYSNTCEELINFLNILPRHCRQNLNTYLYQLFCTNLRKYTDRLLKIIMNGEEYAEPDINTNKLIPLWLHFLKYLIPKDVENQNKLSEILSATTMSVDVRPLSSICVQNERLKQLLVVDLNDLSSSELIQLIIDSDQFNHNLIYSKVFHEDLEFIPYLKYYLCNSLIGKLCSYSHLFIEQSFPQTILNISYEEIAMKLKDNINKISSNLSLDNDNTKVCSLKINPMESTNEIGERKSDIISDNLTNFSSCEDLLYPMEDVRPEINRLNHLLAINSLQPNEMSAILSSIVILRDASMHLPSNLSKYTRFSLKEEDALNKLQMLIDQKTIVKLDKQLRHTLLLLSQRLGLLALQANKDLLRTGLEIWLSASLDSELIFTKQQVQQIYYALYLAEQINNQEYKSQTDLYDTFDLVEQVILQLKPLVNSKFGAEIKGPHSLCPIVTLFIENAQQLLEQVTYSCKVSTNGISNHSFDKQKTTAENLWKLISCQSPEVIENELSSSIHTQLINSSEDITDAEKSSKQISNKPYKTLKRCPEIDECNILQTRQSYDRSLSYGENDHFQLNSQLSCDSSLSLLALYNEEKRRFLSWEEMTETRLRKACERVENLLGAIPEHVYLQNNSGHTVTQLREEVVLLKSQLHTMIKQKFLKKDNLIYSSDESSVLYKKDQRNYLFDGSLYTQENQSSYQGKLNFDYIQLSERDTRRPKTSVNGRLSSSTCSLKTFPSLSQRINQNYLVSCKPVTPNHVFSSPSNVDKRILQNSFDRLNELIEIRRAIVSGSREELRRLGIHSSSSIPYYKPFTLIRPRDNKSFGLLGSDSHEEWLSSNQRNTDRKRNYTTHLCRSKDEYSRSNQAIEDLENKLGQLEKQILPHRFNGSVVQ
ncbi:unnamed protein product [Schistosoma mattheei]|uniref:Uncharacterized protein n=1 Tax=Schistosoma mattheei TaxID=31246 RepID=A0AA85B8Z1_9TREM|nr:unnamed protein product [Schistosoma mattheei]